MNNHVPDESIRPFFSQTSAMMMLSPTERVVVLQLPEDVSTTMLADLLALLREMTDLREEQEGVVDKITTGVSTGNGGLSCIRTPSCAPSHANTSIFTVDNIKIIYYIKNKVKLPCICSVHGPYEEDQHSRERLCSGSAQEYQVAQKGHRLIRYALTLTC